MSWLRGDGSAKPKFVGKPKPVHVTANMFRTGPWTASEVQMLRDMRHLQPHRAHTIAVRVAQNRERRLEMDAGTYGAMRAEHEYLDRLFEWQMPDINTCAGWDKEP